MKEVLKKYGARVASFAAIAGAMTLPLLAKADNLADVMSASGNVLKPTPLTGVIGAVIGTLLGILGVILVLLIIWAGFQWMTAQGDPGKVDKAKKMIYSAIIGLLIVFAAYAITTFVIANLTSIADGQVGTSN